MSKKEETLKELKEIKTGVLTVFYDNKGSLTMEAESWASILGLAVVYLEEGNREKIKELLKEVERIGSHKWLVPFLKKAIDACV